MEEGAAKGADKSGLEHGGRAVLAFLSTKKRNLTESSTFQRLYEGGALDGGCKQGRLHWRDCSVTVLRLLACV